MNNAKTNYLAILDASAIRDAQACSGNMHEADPLNDDEWYDIHEPMLVGLYHGTCSETKIQAARYARTVPENIVLVDLDDPESRKTIERVPAYEKKKAEKTRNIIAIEYDGRDVQALMIELSILSNDPSFDIRKAVKDACVEFARTPDGRKAYEDNCGSFNWGDFVAYVPDEICRNHGFERIMDTLSQIKVDFNEQLVAEDDLN